MKRDRITDFGLAAFQGFIKGLYHGKGRDGHPVGREKLKDLRGFQEPPGKEIEAPPLRAGFFFIIPRDAFAD